MTIPSTHNADSRLTTLDVLGVGISVEMFERLKIVEELQKFPKGSILPPTSRDYLSGAHERKLMLEWRSAKVLAAAIEKFPENWPIPSVCIWPERDKNNLRGEESLSGYFDERVSSLRLLAGLDKHAIAPIAPIFLNEPEDILERTFRFFEYHTDVPALLLFATDSDMIVNWWVM